MFRSVFLLFLLMFFVSAHGSEEGCRLHGRFYLAQDDAFPSASDLPGWLSTLKPVRHVDLTGGNYWYFAGFENEGKEQNWVLEPDDRLINKVDVRIYSRDGGIEQFSTGYQAHHQFMLHYGKRVFIPAGAKVGVLVHFSSPYYASMPVPLLYPERIYARRVFKDNVLILAAFGALLTLSLYNLFIFLITKEISLVYYASYLISYFLGWAFTLGLPASLFGWRDLHFHYIWFFLLPVLNTLFYLDFLKLKQHFPKLAKISRINLILPILLLPSCFFDLSHAHLFATAVISIWLVIALVSGIAVMSRGFHPARYFVLAFLAILVPGSIILPANWGLVPELVRNSELITLLGGTLDGILLAFAVADKIRELSREKDQALQRLGKMLALTRTDHLTGISNRHAFDQSLSQNFCEEGNCIDQLTLFLIDLDGLKRVNDCYGHVKGDELLKLFASSLAALESDSLAAFRLGGDEFTLLVRREKAPAVVEALARIERDIRESGFPDTGISYGISHASESGSAEEMLVAADSRMYQNKVSRRQARESGWIPARDIA